MAVMEALQPLTIAEAPLEVQEANVVIPDNEILQRQQYVDFVALGGLLTEDDGSFITMTVGQFASTLGVSRQSLYNWKKTISDFDKKVRARRLQLSQKSRATKVYNGLYLRACKGDPLAVKLWAEIFDGYQPAPQRLQHSLGDGFADAMKIARTRREGAIEAEVVEQ